MYLKRHAFKRFFAEFGFIPLLYIVAFSFLYLCFYFLGYIDALPCEENIINWDAGYYDFIKQSGYIHHWYQASDTAFFPLFPYVWRVLHIGGLGICAFNFFVFFAGLYILHKAFQIRSLYALCFISMPSAIFFFLPYTEAFFFFFSSLILAGLHKNNRSWVIAGLFFCSLTRGTSMFFLPAILFTEIAGADDLRRAIKDAFYYALATLAGLAVVVLIQYAQTYEWFAFARQQTKFWGHKFNWPHLPFVTYQEGKIIWLDGLALFFGMLAITILLLFAIKFCFSSKDPVLRQKPFWFSVVYLSAVTLYSIFFNPRSDGGFTELVSINRYLFATAFFLLFFTESLKIFSANLKTAAVYFSIGLLAWFSLGVGGATTPLTALFASWHGAIIFCAGLSLYTFLFYFLLNRRYASHLATALFCFNLALSVHVLSLFIHIQWVA